MAISRKTLFLARASRDEQNKNCYFCTEDKHVLKVKWFCVISYNYNMTNLGRGL